jgi:superfamily II DNA or RNA helicase
MFLNDYSVRVSWQAFERLVCRYLLYSGFTGVRLVGQTNDKGTDVIAHKANKRWLIQVKHYAIKIGPEVLDRTIESLGYYRGDIPVVVSLNGFTEPALKQQQALMAQKIPMQLWSASKLIGVSSKFGDRYPLGDPSLVFDKRDYQEEAIQILVKEYNETSSGKGLIVMATGMGKTRVACEFVRRMNIKSAKKVLVLAHTNALVYQLERSFWPYLKATAETLVWNGYEKQDLAALERSNYVFACSNSVSAYLEKGNSLPQFDIVFIDECHHVGNDGMYKRIIDDLGAGQSERTFLLGVTATPWRPDDTDLQEAFGPPLITVDLVTGMKNGFLSQVDYRMFTDNINWEAINELEGSKFSPRKINRTLFISEWDDAVVFELQKAWKEQENPRAIVFCGTVDHAITMRDRINSLGFCSAEAIFSQTKGGLAMKSHERNRVLCDFDDGTIQVVCAIDIFNEGIDVPDVNIVVFQRVTHSRRIFIQQLGRGLRLSENKSKVIVLDFVSDIRRFAAGLKLKNDLCSVPNDSDRVKRVRLNHEVKFCKVGGEDKKSEAFLKEWLDDVTAIEDAGEDSSILKFPPLTKDSKK